MGCDQPLDPFGRVYQHFADRFAANMIDVEGQEVRAILMDRSYRPNEYQEKVYSDIKQYELKGGQVVGENTDGRLIIDGTGYPVGGIKMDVYSTWGTENSYKNGKAIPTPTRYVYSKTDDIVFYNLSATIWNLVYYIVGKTDDASVLIAWINHSTPWDVRHGTLTISFSKTEPVNCITRVWNCTKYWSS